MKRIDPATVPDVFRRRNLKPATGVFVGDVTEGECCILSALYCDAKGCEDPATCLVEIEAMQTCGEPPSLGDHLAGAIGLVAEYESPGSTYADGVMHGWDTDALDGYVFSDNAYDNGIRDGIAAREAVAEAGLKVVAFPETDDDGDWDDDDEEE